MKRLAAASLALLLFWALVPAVGEFFENAVHYLQEGHTAHALADDDHHDPTGPEHGCGGAVHLCSCCVSLSCLPTHVATGTSAPGSRQLPAVIAEHLSGPSGRGVYHPPRV